MQAQITTFSTAFYFNQHGRAFANADGKFSIWDLWALTGFAAKSRPTTGVYGAVYGTSPNGSHLLDVWQSRDYMREFANRRSNHQGFRKSPAEVHIISANRIEDARRNFLALPQHREPMGFMPKPSASEMTLAKPTPSPFGFFAIQANEYFYFMNRKFYGAGGYYLYNSFSETPSIPASIRLEDTFPMYTIPRTYSKSAYRQTFAKLVKAASPRLQRYLTELDAWNRIRFNSPRHRQFLRELRDGEKDDQGNVLVEGTRLELRELKKKAKRLAERVDESFSRHDFSRFYDKDTDFMLPGKNPLVFKSFSSLMLTLSTDVGLKPQELEYACTVKPIRCSVSELDEFVQAYRDGFEARVRRF